MPGAIKAACADDQGARLQLEWEDTKQQIRQVSRQLQTEQVTAKLLKEAETRHRVRMHVDACLAARFSKPCAADRR